MGFISTIEPTKIDPDRWWVHPSIDDPYSLKPQPDRSVMLVVGDGRYVIDDIDKFQQICTIPFDTMCINYSYKLMPWPIQHFVAGDSHMEDMQSIAQSLSETVLKHCWNPHSKGFHVRWHRTGQTGWDGTTANLALKIGVSLGYLKIVLAGCPMDTSGNWYTPLLKEQDIKCAKNHKVHLWKWTEIATRPVSRLCRSMSGETAKLLGEPTTNWLEDI